MLSQEEESETEAPNECGPTSTTGFNECLRFPQSCKTLNLPDTPSFSTLSSDIISDSSTVAHRQTVMLHSFQSKTENSALPVDSTESVSSQEDKDDNIESVYSKQLRELPLEDNRDVTQRSYVAADVKSSCEKYNGPQCDNALVLPYQEETHYVQNITKLPPNFTLNVESSIGNLTALHNVVQAVTSSNQTLWLPTILTSDSITSVRNNAFENDPVSQSGISQIILTSGGDSFSSQNTSNQVLPAKLRHSVTSAESVPGTPNSSKVQILSNIALSKHANLTTFTQQGLISPNPKEPMSTHIYSQPSNLYRSANIPPKHGINTSVLSINNKVPKSQIIQNSMSVSHFANPLLKNSNISNCNMNLPTKSSSDTYMMKSYGKINTGTSSVTSVTTVNSHILSRTVPGPKLSSSQSKYKNVNTFGTSQKSNKTTIGQSAATYGHSQKVQTSVPIKIIQQTSVPSSHKQSFKNWPVSRPHVHSVKNSYVTSNVLNSKNLTAQSHVNQVKLNHPLHLKNVEAGISIEKTAANADQHSKISSHTPENVHIVHQSKSQLSTALNQQNMRFTHAYIGPHENHVSLNIPQNVAHVSANQHLTAQILQSLSQPKPTVPVPTQVPAAYMKQIINEHYAVKIPDQKRYVHGDPTDSFTADDIIGTEERPNLSQEIYQSPCMYSMQLVMLDHTYAVCTQAISPVTTNSNSTGVTSVTPVVTPMDVSSTLSPTKVNTLISTSPIIVSSQSNVDNQLHISPTNISLQTTALSSSQSLMLYKPVCTTLKDDDDDAGSVISSDGEQRPRADSDTETAPEGEEEGKTRCVCEFTHDDGYMICCDRCSEWQHVDCMGIDRQNIPDDYMCDRCQPRAIDRRRAKAIQLRKQEELKALTVPSDSDSTSGTSHSLGNRRRRLLTVTTYSNTSGNNRHTTTYPSTVVTPLTQSTKRGPKRPRRTDLIRKGMKRKLSDKRQKKKRDLLPHRNKYNALIGMSSEHDQWNDSYEPAMTNHYSPELRAKLNRYGSRLTSGAQINTAISAHHCTTVPHAGGKILIATKELKENTPIIELRGKYMLSAQQRLQPQPAGRAGSQRPGPYLFFYRLPRDNTQVCIDTRTYGNEARFVRRSCKPNAELQHCIVKGTLHVYLITTSAIQSNTEITIIHDSSNVKQPCACGNPKYCKVNGLNTPLSYKTIASEPSLREKRHSRRISAASPASPPLSLLTKEIMPVIPESKIDKKPLIKNDYDQDEILVKEESIDKHLSPDTTSQELELQEVKFSELPAFDPNINKNDKIILDDVISEVELKPKVEEIKLELHISRENTPERKIPTVPSDLDIVLKDEKASNKLKEEKMQLGTGMVRRSSVHATRASRTSVTTSQESADEKSDESFDAKQVKSDQAAKDKKKMTREERKMEAIMKAIERMEKEEQRKQEVKDRQSKRRESDTQHSTSLCVSEAKENYDQEDDNQSVLIKRRRKRKGRTRTVSCSQSNMSRNRLNSADSDMVTSGDEAAAQISPIPQPEVSSSSQANFKMTPHEEDSLFSSTLYDSNMTDSDVGLSSACLLVEAAVGPLESAFKLPKTKKSIVNEWLGKSPERSTFTDIGMSPPYGSSNENNNGSPLLSIDKRPLSLERLVHVAATMIGDLSGGAICTDSSPEKNCSNDSLKLEQLSKSFSKSPILSSPIKSPHSPQIQMTNTNVIDVSPQRIIPKRSPRNILRDLPQSSPDKVKLPKKYRKNMKNNLEEQNTIHCNKRVLRSGLTTSVSPNREEIEAVQSSFEEENIDQTVFVEPSTSIIQSSITTSTLTGLQPPQHSAKKRWLRQAISEESDSPTAESPPNEVITPLKKRRLARESLSSDYLVQNSADESNANLSKPLNYVTAESDNKQSANIAFAILSDTKLKEDCFAEVDLSISKKDDDDDSLGNVYSRYNCTDDLLNIDIKSASKDSKRKLNLDIERIIGVPPKLEEPTSQTNVDQMTNTKVDKDLECNLLQSPMKCDKDLKQEAPEIPLKNELDDIVIATVNATDSSAKAGTETAISDKAEPFSNINSTETSGNSSPLLDEMDDIQKKIHSFHTENIQILKIRNKKQPKEKRKKVNLNFDLCVLADQTVSVKLRSETDEVPAPISSEINGEVEFNSAKPSVLSESNTVDNFFESSVKPVVKSGSNSVDNSIVSCVQPTVTSGTNQVDLFVSSIKSPIITASNPVDDIIVSSPPPSTPIIDTSLIQKEFSESEITSHVTSVSEKVKEPEETSKSLYTQLTKVPLKTTEDVKFNTGTGSQHLFSALFDGEKVFSSSSDLPNMLSLKNAIDMTANMESSIFEKSVNEYKNVQEILTRVNKIDLSNSLLLSGVLRDAESSATMNQQKCPTPTKLFANRSNDPRLNPPPVNKPKPVRRKLSISEYRKRHKMCSTSDGARSGSDSNGSSGSAGHCPSSGVTATSTGNAPSPLRLDDDDFDSRLEKQLEDSMNEQSVNTADVNADQKGVFSAQPTQLEKQRETLNERLRREYGLSLPEDEEARSATSLQGSWSASDSLNISTAIQMHLPAAVLENHPETISLTQRIGDSESTGNGVAKFPRLDR